MRVLGIETSCDETGIAVYDTEHGLLAHALHSQVGLHDQYGGVVPELASRDHVRRVLPLIRQVLHAARIALADIDAIGYTAGPGLAGALLVGSAIGASLAYALDRPAILVHHLEGHLLAPLLAADPPEFPFLALIVSGGHTQLMTVEALGRYQLLGETLDDAAGEAFDKTAKLLGLPYPGGAALAVLAEAGNPRRFALPRPMLHSGDLNFSFSGLKTAVLTLVRGQMLDHQARRDLAAAVQEAIVDVLCAKSLAAIRVSGHERFVIAGGVGANRRLRAKLEAGAASVGCKLHYPAFEFCTDNGAMIALAAALRLMQANPPRDGLGFVVRPRWDLATHAAGASA